VSDSDTIKVCKANGFSLFQEVSPMRKSLDATLNDNFKSAHLLTLQFTPVFPVPAEMARKQFANWLLLARLRVGGAFRYVNIPEHGTDAPQDIVYRFITDLPLEQCEEIASLWAMGAATVEPVNEAQLSALARDSMARQGKTGRKGRRAWSASMKIHENSRTTAAI
jgi:hypothetical protein